MLSGAWVGNDSAWLSENTGITLKRNRKACTPNWPQQTPGFSHASEMWQVLAPHWHNKIFAKIHLVLLVTTIFLKIFFPLPPSPWLCSCQGAQTPKITNSRLFAPNKNPITHKPTTDYSSEERGNRLDVSAKFWMWWLFSASRCLPMISAGQVILHFLSYFS